jgi:hypothetical protein
MPETLSFTFTSKELQTLIETAIEKAVSKMGINLSLANRSNRGTKFVKIKEFAQEFNVTAAAVHKWILERKIYAEKLEGTRIWRIPIEEIERYKDKSRKTTKRDIFNRRF